MILTELLAGFGGLALVGGLSAWLGRVWAARILEQDRLRYQTQMETLLQDLRTRGSKELFVHQLQFEKEFQIYLELWKEVLALGRAASEFRQLKLDSGQTPAEQKQALIEAYNSLTRRVSDHRPFYAPEVHACAQSVLKPCRKIAFLRSIIRDPDSGTWEHTETLLDEADAAIDPLCDAIRRRIWPDGQSTAPVPEDLHHD